MERIIYHALGAFYLQAPVADPILLETMAQHPGSGPRVLVVRLPCAKVYPVGPVYLASLVHRAQPGAELRVLDLALVPPAQALARMSATAAQFKPDEIAFSWRDIQVFSPQDADGGFRAAFAFMYESSLPRLAAASLLGLREVLLYGSSISRNLRIVNRAARELPGSRVSLGGPSVQIFADRLRSRLSPRVLLHSDPELGPFFRGAGLELPSDPMEPGLDLPYLESIFPQWAEYRGSTIGVQTKRGCPRECLYCLYPRLEGSLPRRRSPRLVAEEIEAYARRWGIRSFWLADAQLLSVDADRGHLAEILGRMAAARLDASWSGYLRVDQVDPELARLMVASGLRDLELSIGSGAQSVVDALRLGFSVEETMRGLANLKEAGYSGRVLVNLSLNAPGETRETLLETLAAVQRIRDLLGPERVVPVIFFLAIQPGTGLEALALEQGRLKAGYDPLSIWPWNAASLIHNPPPLGAMLGRACARAFRGSKGGGDGSGSGDRVLAEIAQELSGSQGPGGALGKGG
jgi:hypothetical protein